MPSTYVFGSAKASDAVSKALLFVAKFSRKQALIKFSNSSVSVIWGGSPKSYYIHAEATNMDMFDGRVNSCAVVQADPTALGRILRGLSQEKTVALTIIKPNRIQVVVSYSDTTTRTITHTLPCDIKTKGDYELMCIDIIEHRVFRYNTRSYIDTVGRIKHILDSFARLGTPRIYLHSRQEINTNSFTINAKNEGSIIDVYLVDLPDGHNELNSEDDMYTDQPRRNSAGVQVDPKKLALYLSGLFTGSKREQVERNKPKVCLDIEHNKCLKISMTNEVSNGEKMYQSLLLLHSLAI